ncbi:MAG: mechanosensitive ion channel family protein [Saprospiraceae bacterium]
MNFDINDIIEKAQEYIQEYLLTILSALAILIIGWFLIGLIMKGIERLLNRSKLDPSVKGFLISLLSVVLKVMLIIAVADKLGIPTNSFVAILGAATFAIGFALQGGLANFAGGVLILFFKPYKIGDLIEAQGFKGVVQEIQIFNTILAAPGGKKMIVPNGGLSNGAITNFTEGDGNVVLALTLGIGYTDDIDKAREVIKAVVASCPFIKQENEPLIKVVELADSSVNFLVGSDVTVATYWDAHFYMHEHIKKEFDKAGIGIPYPQMDVHVHK